MYMYTYIYIHAHTRTHTYTPHTHSQTRTHNILCYKWTVTESVVIKSKLTVYLMQGSGGHCIMCWDSMGFIPSWDLVIGA